MTENSRLTQICDTIEDYVGDAHTEGYHAGYDEAWDEVADKKYDEGWDDCAAYYSEKIARGEEAIDSSCPRDDAGDKICSYSSVTEAHKEGYDEGYDTAMSNFEADERVGYLVRKARADGWEAGLDGGQLLVTKWLMENFEGSNFFATPESREELDAMLVTFSNNGPMSVAITLNYLQKEAKQWL